MSAELSRILKMPVNLNLSFVCLLFGFQSISTWLLPWDTRPSSVPLRHDLNATRSSISRPARRSFCSLQREKQHKNMKNMHFWSFLDCKILCDTCKHANIPFPCMPFQGPECRKSMHSSKQSLVCKSTSFWEYQSGSQLEVIHPIALKKAERLNGKGHTQTAGWFQKVSDGLGRYLHRNDETWETHKSWCFTEALWCLKLHGLRDSNRTEGRFLEHNKKHRFFDDEIRISLAPRCPAF